jgi:serine/threonine protein kinase
MFYGRIISYKFKAVNMIEAGKILQNRYRIEKQIGQGGMGTVFVAVDERFGSTVAIKETFFEEENLSKAFEREARLLNSLKHPALPKVSDFFAEENGQFIVMEFISGEDLSEILEKSDKPFSVEEVLNWADQLCDALKYLHTQDMPVIHRDIKPQNLKLTPSNQIILLDFGLAKGNPTDVSHKTAAKSIFGYSRNYASLEQIQGTGTDPQSDLYSLAATLYHLMTGIPPADALTRAMNVLNAKSDPLIPANLINKKIPKAVAQVLQQSMALNANERPASAVEMSLMLENCDKSIDLNADVEDFDAVFAPDLLTQKTKLMSRATNINQVAESELKTDILTPDNSEDNSTETRIARPFATTAPKSRKVVLLFGTAFSGLLVFGGLGYFMMNPAQKADEPAAENQIEQKQVLPSNTAVAVANSQPTTDNSNSFVNVESAESNMAIPETNIVENKPAKVESKTTLETPKKQTETAKTTNNEPKVEVWNLDDPEEVIIETKDGKVKIKGETFETEDFIMGPNGIKIKNPAKFPGFGRGPISPEQFRKMSPEQRQKFADMMERQKRIKDLEKPMPIPPKQPPLKDNQN